MLGAIIGDICGSRWESGQPQPGHFKMFAEHSGFTDDTVCTVAIADALMSDRDFAAKLRGWCRRYRYLEYGGRFKAWFLSEDGAYGSYGNGGSMRVSSIALLSTTLDEAASLARRSAAVTHDHPEGMRGADVIATLSWMALHGHSPDALMRAARAAGYDPQKPSEVTLSTDAADTVPVAIWAALTSRNFEHAIELGAYCGGDTDTICSMTGSIAEHLHGIPDVLVRRALPYLDPPLLEVVKRAYESASQRGNLHSKSISVTRSGLKGMSAGPVTEIAHLVRRVTNRVRRSGNA